MLTAIAAVQKTADLSADDNGCLQRSPKNAIPVGKSRPTAKNEAGRKKESRVPNPKSEIYIAAYAGMVNI